MLIVVCFCRALVASSFFAHAEKAPANPEANDGDSADDGETQPQHVITTTSAIRTPAFQDLTVVRVGARLEPIEVGRGLADHEASHLIHVIKVQGRGGAVGGRGGMSRCRQSDDFRKKTATWRALWVGDAAPRLFSSGSLRKEYVDRFLAFPFCF